MPLQPWEHLNEETLARYKVFDVVKARRRSPRTGQDLGFFLIRTEDWVNVVPVTDEGRLILVRQYRHGTETFTLEIPGGLIHRGEDPALAAARELREETGYAARELRPLGRVRPNPALFGNVCHTYLASGCARVGELEMDSGEDIEVVEVPLAEVPDLVRAGGIDHALVVAALYFHDLDSRPRAPARQMDP